MSPDTTCDAPASTLEGAAEGADCAAAVALTGCGAAVCGGVCVVLQAAVARTAAKATMGTGLPRCSMVHLLRHDQSGVRGSKPHRAIRACCPRSFAMERRAGAHDLRLRRVGMDGTMVQVMSSRTTRTDTSMTTK